MSHWDESFSNRCKYIFSPFLQTSMNATLHLAKMMARVLIRLTRTNANVRLVLLEITARKVS
jgi:hypothetical protein